MPFFSVVIPTYNRSRMVLAAALSVLAQSEEDWECFIVDDGSTDGTPALLERLPKDPRLKILLQEKNSGQHVCRNRAIRASAGRFITFLDSDDLYLPRRLASFRTAAESRPEIGFWFSNAYVLRYSRVVGRLFDPARPIPEGVVPGHYAVGDEFLPYLTSQVAVRREAFDAHGLFREDLRILEDTELYARMLSGGLPVGAIRDCLAVRRLHESQITREHERDFLEALAALAAAKPPPDVLKRKREALALEVASYLWKDARPGRARALLERELGARARRLPSYWRTFLPPAALRGAKALRRAWLMGRYGLLAPREFGEARAAVEPFLEGAAKLCAPSGT